MHKARSPGRTGSMSRKSFGLSRLLGCSAPLTRATLGGQSCARTPGGTCQTASARRPLTWCHGNVAVRQASSRRDPPPPHGVACWQPHHVGHPDVWAPSWRSVRAAYHGWVDWATTFAAALLGRGSGCRQPSPVSTMIGCPHCNSWVAIDCSTESVLVASRRSIALPPRLGLVCSASSQ